MSCPFEVWVLRGRWTSPLSLTSLTIYLTEDSLWYLAVAILAGWVEELCKLLIWEQTDGFTWDVAVAQTITWRQFPICSVPPNFLLILFFNFGTVPLIKKSRASCPGGRFPHSFIYQVINITRLKRLYNFMFSPWRWPFKLMPTRGKISTQLKFLWFTLYLIYSVDIDTPPRNWKMANKVVFASLTYEPPYCDTDTSHGVYISCNHLC